MSASDSYVRLSPGRGPGAAAWRLPDSRWVVPLALAAPFLLVVAALRGMTATLPIFHTDDERIYHYPTILRFGHELPFPDLAHYKAAQTPFFHVLMAYVGKLTGYELWRLRLVEVLISYLLALAVFALLHRRVGLDRAQSLILTLLFVLSPYVFGSSFRLITDNLALLFSVLAIERFERFRETNRLGPFLVGCGCVALAMLTRQSTAFLLGVGALYALRPGLRWDVRLPALAGLGLAAVPVGLLFLTWHGLVPPGGDPSSCALCPAGRAGPGATQGGLEVQTPELALATIGLYGAVLFGPSVLSRSLADPRGVLRAARGPLLGALAGALLLVAFPATSNIHSAGLVWNVAKRFSTIDGSSLVFWLLVPLAGAVVWARLRAAPRRWLVAVLLFCFLVAALAIRYPWQKYVDPFALLVLLLSVRRDELASWRAQAGAAVLAVGFVAYTLSFVV